MSLFRIGANLDAMNVMRGKFQCPIGYSDNGESTLVDHVAVSLGANIIEKHFTLDKKMDGPDQFFSIDPPGLKKLISEIRQIEKIKGDGKKIPRPSEIEGRYSIRTSITANSTISEGQILTSDVLGVKRPAEGIEPKFMKRVIGKKANKEIQIDSAIHWDDII